MYGVPYERHGRFQGDYYRGRGVWKISSSLHSLPALAASAPDPPSPLPEDSRPPLTPVEDSPPAPFLPPPLVEVILFMAFSINFSSLSNRSSSSSPAFSSAGHWASGDVEPPKRRIMSTEAMKCCQRVLLTEGMVSVTMRPRFRRANPSIS